jgi:hypothetical protein
MATMIDLAPDLRLVFADSIDFGRGGYAIGLVKRAVSLQKRVLREQGLPEDLALLYRDSVGNANDPGSIAEDNSYGHLLAVNPQRNGQPIGMRAMELASITDLGDVVLDYYPALVPLAEQRKLYGVDRSKIQRGATGVDEMNLVKILMEYDQNIPSGMNVAARVTDGVGIQLQFLRDAGYRKCELEFGVPSLDAETLRQYKSIVGKLAIYALFEPGRQPELSPAAAEDLIVQNYLIKGYLNLTDDLAHVELTGSRPKKIGDLRFIRQAREKIAAAVEDHGSVRFERF